MNVEQIQMHLPDLTDHSKGRDVFLSFKEDVATLVWQGYHIDQDEQGVMMKKTSQMQSEKRSLQKRSNLQDLYITPAKFSQFQGHLCPL